MCRACLEDSDFGRLFIQGANPVVIRKVSILPDKLAVHQELLESLMDRDQTITEEMKAGCFSIWKLPKSGKG